MMRNFIGVNEPKNIGSRKETRIQNSSMLRLQRGVSKTPLLEFRMNKVIGVMKRKALPMQLLVILRTSI